MAQKTPDFDEHGRGRDHPAYQQPIVGHADHPGGTGVEDGMVAPDRQRLGLGGSGGWLDEHVDERALYEPLTKEELREVRELLERERSRAA